MKRKPVKPTQPKIHDAGYKKLFSNRTIFQQLIETFITETWVKELDFSQCETLDKSLYVAAAAAAAGCVGVCGCVWVCAGVCGCVWVCVGVWGGVGVCVCV